MTLPVSLFKRPVAHRGLHDATRGIIENSPMAFQAAVDHGYGIELDLQLSADGHAIVFHDSTLDRVTDASGPVAARSAADLKKVALTGGSDVIPTLAQVLEQVAGRVPLLIELKQQDRVGPLEQATIEALTGYSGDVALMSFHPGMVATCADLAPDVPRGITGMDFARTDHPERDRLTDYADLASTGSVFVSHRWQDLDIPSVQRLRGNGVPVLCWTVKSEADEVTARAGADNITFEGYLPA